MISRVWRQHLSEYFAALSEKVASSVLECEQQRSFGFANEPVPADATGGQAPFKGAYWLNEHESSLPCLLEDWERILRDAGHAKPKGGYFCARLQSGHRRHDRSIA
ncbi:hypothetical protein [uncultured Xanthomonas sp.]|uniref:hypothetical protein n=1 Tax=uncultured Xanthomonas sp. TaxID=152831 RepID=UPI0025FF38A6|nr:hypothetical protein [uncultured Xanthomonas sp.]